MSPQYGQPNFASLNRGRHLYSAGRPWRWALAHILVLSSFFFFFPRLISAVADWMSTILRLPHMVKFRTEVWNVLHAACWNTGRKNDAENRHLGTIAQLCRAISSQPRHVSTIGKKNLLNSNIFLTYPHNIVNFGGLAAEICWRVWDIPANLTVSRLGSNTARNSSMGVRQTLRRWTEGATYIRQGGHHVWHWPTF